MNKKSKIIPIDDISKCQSNGSAISSIDLKVKMIQHIGKDLFDELINSIGQKISLEKKSKEKGIKITVGTLVDFSPEDEDSYSLRFEKSVYSINTDYIGNRKIIEYSEDGCIVDVNTVDEYSLLDQTLAMQMIDNLYMEIRNKML